MKGKYSRQVKTAVKLIWSSFDRDEIRRGYSILILEAQKGDADALAFIARCFMGESYVWPQAGFKADDEERDDGQCHGRSLCCAKRKPHPFGGTCNAVRLV